MNSMASWCMHSMAAGTACPERQLRTSRQLQALPTQFHPHTLTHSHTPSFPLHPPPGPEEWDEYGAKLAPGEFSQAGLGLPLLGSPLKGGDRGGAGGRRGRCVSGREGWEGMA